MRSAGGGRRGAAITSLTLLLALAIGATGCVAPPVELTSLQTACTVGLQQAAASRDRDSRRNRLLYYLQLGTYQHTCGLWQESATSFETAKRIGDELYTKSLRDEAATWLVNDNTRAYPGERFELVLVRVLNAFNHLAAGRQEDALVEARQIDFLLREIDLQLGGDGAHEDGAFARFLTGMLHEEAGDLDSARISYRLALSAYAARVDTDGVPAPQVLLDSARAVAERQGSEGIDELDRFGASSPRRLPPGTGEVIVVHEVGRVPAKVDRFITVTWGEGWLYINEYGSEDRDANAEQVRDIAASILASDTFRVAFPELRRRPSRIEGLRVRSPELVQTRGPFVVEDVAALAARDLETRIARVRTKTIARAAFYFALKNALQRKMEREGRNDMTVLIEVLAQLRNFAAERADTRQWRTLPEGIQLSSAVLPAGFHTLEIDYMGTGPGGADSVLRSEVIPEVDVRDGRRTFLVVRTVQ